MSGEYMPFALSSEVSAYACDSGGHDSISARQHDENVESAMACACPPPLVPVEGGSAVQ